MQYNNRQFSNSTYYNASNLFYVQVGNDALVMRLINKNNLIEQYQIIQRIPAHATSASYYSMFQPKTPSTYQSVQTNNSLSINQNECLNLFKQGCNANSFQYQQYNPNNTYHNTPVNTFPLVQPRDIQGQYLNNLQIQQKNQNHFINKHSQQNQQIQNYQGNNLNQEQYVMQIRQQQLLQNFLTNYYRKQQIDNILEKSQVLPIEKKINNQKNQPNKNRQEHQSSLSCSENASSTHINELISMIYKLEYTETEQIKCEGCDKNFIGKFRWIMHVKADHPNIENEVIKIHLYKEHRKKESKLNTASQKGKKAKSLEAKLSASSKKSAENKPHKSVNKMGKN